MGMPITAEAMVELPDSSKNGGNNILSQSNSLLSLSQIRDLIDGRKYLVESFLAGAACILDFDSCDKLAADELVMTLGSTREIS
jgi:hypothetical protein